MLGDRSSYPRVGELQQQGAAGAEKERAFAIDPPAQRSRAKHPLAFAGRLCGECGKPDFECFRCDDLHRPARRPKPCFTPNVIGEAGALL